ncbi:D-2-hydroxyacid dehydrogenase [Litchfieldella rifensis]|uniref:D-2-hydroxyacid dehydrogenase n=1 Tax=Litchfieldella rifensis TaxID=762643 RepID=A0ABV7LSK8_9GAMM
MSQLGAPTAQDTPFPIRHILYLQKSQLLEQQRELVSSLLKDALPEAEIVFAGDVESVPQGVAFDVVIAPTLPWLPDALHKLDGYRWIHFLSAGVEKIWEMDFDKTHTLMTKSCGVHGAPISEYVIGAILYFTKQFGRFHDQTRRGEWQRTWLGELTGCQLTVLGLGHIGQCLALRATAFDMRVVGTLRHLRPVKHVDRVVPWSLIGEELARTDFLVVCLPLTDDTRGLVNDELLAKLKPHALLVDISRGGVVKGEAVLRALDNGTLQGAALDVFEQRALSKESRLWKRDDILITPHVAGTTPFYLKRALGVFVENLRAQQQGLPFTTPVSIELGY